MSDITNSNKKKSDQLGMPHGTANNRLRKSIIFKLVRDAKLDVCFRCELKIESIENFSIEHKVAWLDSENPTRLFFNLDNIAFSHLACNARHSRHPSKGQVAPHGTDTRYSRPQHCRCNECRTAHSKAVAVRRARQKARRLQQ